MKLHQHFITAVALSTFALPTFAESLIAEQEYLEDYIKITAFLGAKQDITVDIGDDSNDRTKSVRFSQALALNWAYAENAEGELLFSNSLRNDKDINIKHYIQYLHVGGRILFRDETPFSTSIALGVGGTYLNPKGSQYSAETAFSGSMAAGVRYQLSEQVALRSDLRVYGTLLREGHSESFCVGLDTCEDGYFVEAELLAGVEYKF